MPSQTPSQTWIVGPAVALATWLCTSVALAVTPTPITPPTWGWPNGDANGYWDHPLGTVQESNPFGASSWQVAGAGVLADGINFNNTGLEQTITYTLEIPNDPQPDKTKFLWLSWDIHVSPGGEATDKVEGDNDGDWTTDDVLEARVPPAKLTPIDNDWDNLAVNWKLTPQPMRERLIIVFKVPEGGSWGIRNVFYSSLCVVPVPEPASLSLLGLGAVTLIRRKR